MKYIFNAVSVSTSFVSEIEVVFATGPLKRSSAINEKHCVIYIVFL